MTKFGFIHLLKYTKNGNVSHPIWLDDQKVRPVSKCGILRFILDSTLNWNSTSSILRAKQVNPSGPQYPRPVDLGNQPQRPPTDILNYNFSTGN